MYLLRYEIGQEYKPHHDYFSEEVHIKVKKKKKLISFNL